MKKIISLFQRNYDGDRLVRNEVVPGAEWVPAGEGVATRKFDGTSCLVRGGKLYKRYDVRGDYDRESGRSKAMFSYTAADGRVFRYNREPPEGFVPAQDPDDGGHWPGWVPVGPEPEDCWHRQAFGEAAGVTGRGSMITFESCSLEEGTYELVGPKVQGNPEDAPRHLLVRHGACPLPDCPRDFDGIKAYLAEHDIEGIVWHHPDGRMVKIKGKDFGLKRRKVTDAAS